MNYDNLSVNELILLAAELQQSSNPLFSWLELCQIISNCELSKLNRLSVIEDLYVNQFKIAIKLEFGSTVNYLNSKLNFTETAIQPEEYFQEGTEYKILLNDWSYSVPHNVEHFVVWSKLPILHPSLCSPESESNSKSNKEITWSQVSKIGLSGFLNPSHSLKGFGDTETGPGREIKKFVEENWGEKLKEISWFINPPGLQSVPELYHFHVLVRTL